MTTNEGLYYDPASQQVFVSTSGQMVSQWNVLAFLRGKMAANSSIQLDGCSTARGKDNLAKALSIALSNVSVSGNSSDKPQLAELLWHMIGKPATDTTYLNGKKQ
jgi:hypothetical protein